MTTDAAGSAQPHALQPPHTVPPHVTRARAVCFDIGETIIDKSREYAAWARAVGTTPHTFSAVFGAQVAGHGGGLASTLATFGPDATALRYADLVAAARIPPPGEQDLYPGVRRLLQRLRDAGLRVGVVGNQPDGYSERLQALGLSADVIATSEDWGLAKPDPAFFARVVEELLGPGARADDVVYVGDQVDADVRAGLDAGLEVIRVRQGPWGRLVHDAEVERGAWAVVDRVADVEAVLLGRR